MVYNGTIMTTIQCFNAILSEVKKTEYWKAMERTVENTMWHREASVAVHTEMTIDHYVKTFYPMRTPRQRMLSMMALMAHDFGKPATERKNAEGRNQYLGHEPVSGDLVIEFFVDHREIMQKYYDFGPGDLAAIRFVIDRHLPYGLKKAPKVQALKDEVALYLGDDEEVFFDVLRSDSAGRIMDNREGRLKAVEDWIENFRKVAPPAEPKLSHAERKAAWLAKQADLGEVVKF
jgi:hypothetical protein